MKRVLIVRSGPYQVDPEGYNLQELGLAAALTHNGYQCDVMYYHKKKNSNQVLKKDGYGITVLWRKGIRLLRSGVYPQILSKKFLAQYDQVIISEYSQVMAVLLSNLHDNVYIYNGPYYNLFKIPILEPIYDFLFVRRLNRRTRGVFCKTEKAKQYLENKGFEKCQVVGVGLDIEKFDEELALEENTISLLKKMQNKRNILYVGALSKRKNTVFLIRVFEELKKSNSHFSDLQLILIGKDDDNIVESITNSPFKEDIIYQPFLKNAQLKYVYPEAQLFILPSLQEIFGMVLLEAMFFKTPVISSSSAGGETLIEDGINGTIIPNFEVNEWVEIISKLLSNHKQLQNMGQSAHDRIISHFLWDSISQKMVETFEER